MKNRVVGSQTRAILRAGSQCRESLYGMLIHFYFLSGVLEMKNRVLGNQTMCKLGNHHRTIQRAGSQCRSCDYNSTSGLVSVLTTLLLCLVQSFYYYGKSLRFSTD